ncbi:MAG TPA: hypothetical protein VGC24_00760 [Burkholderiaceae bacterium]
MNGPEIAALRGPSYSADFLASQLVDIGEGLAAAFMTLSRDPHPAACEMLAIRLDGARKHLHLLAEAQRREPQTV